MSIEKLRDALAEDDEVPDKYFRQLQLGDLRAILAAYDELRAKWNEDIIRRAIERGGRHEPPNVIPEPSDYERQHQKDQAEIERLTRELISTKETLKVYQSDANKIRDKLDIILASPLFKGK